MSAADINSDSSVSSSPLTSSYFKIHFNIIIPSTPRSPK